MMRYFLVFFQIFLSLWLTSISHAQSWKEHRSRHFIIYYKNAPKDFIKTVEESAEGYYHSILRDLGFSRDQLWTWNDRAQIYIYDHEQDYIDSARQAIWSRGTAFLGQRTIKTYPAAHGFFDSVLPHELGHIIFREYVGLSAQIPLWMDEGVAMYQEKAKRWGADDEVRKAILENRFISLMDLTRMRLTAETDQETIILFYAESASIVRYLMSAGGSYKFSVLCQHLKKGLSLEQALEQTYYRFKTLQDLNKAWVSHLKK